MKKLSGLLMVLLVAGTLTACATQNQGGSSASGTSGTSGEGMFNSSVRK